MEATAFIHLPEINISGEPLRLAGGEILRSPFTEWVKLDSYYDRFEAQIKRVGEPIFFAYKAERTGDDDEDQRELSKVSKLLHLSLLMYTGTITARPELSVSYRRVPNPSDPDLGDGVLRRIGDAGREYIVNDHTRVRLDKEEEEQIGAIFEFLRSRSEHLELPLVDHFLQTLISVESVGLSRITQITHLVTAIEEMLLPDVTGGIQQQFTERVAHVTGEGTEEGRKLIKSCYQLRSGVVHGQDIEAVVRKSGSDIEGMYALLVNTCLVMLLKILNDLPENAGSEEAEHSRDNIINNVVSLPKLRSRWML